MEPNNTVLSFLVGLCRNDWEIEAYDRSDPPRAGGSHRDFCLTCWSSGPEDQKEIYL